MPQKDDDIMFTTGGYILYVLYYRSHVPRYGREKVVNTYLLLV